MENLTDWPNLDSKQMRSIDKDVANIVKYCNLLTVKQSNLYHVEFFDRLVVELMKRLEVYRTQEKT